MINGKRVIAIIPARGGSKGLPKKNILPIKNKPLISWTIEEAKKSKYLDRVILSSDDDEIIATAIKFDCDVPFVRPKEISTDTATSVEVILHALGSIEGEYDYLVLLQPTSPLRTSHDIDEAIRKCDEFSAPACVSVSESSKSPYWMYSIQAEKLVPILPESNSFSRRQECPLSYCLNGAIYVSDVAKFISGKTLVPTNSVPYVMPFERSIDIDTELDYFLVKYFKENEIL